MPNRPKKKSVSALCLAALAVLQAPPTDLLAQDSLVQIEGQGPESTDPVELGDGMLLVGGAHGGLANFIVELITEEGDLEELVVNRIGDYYGARVLPVDAGTYRFRIQASASWTLLYQELDPEVRGVPLPVSEERQDDTPIGPIAMESGLLEANFTHEGTQNFIVALYRETGETIGLLANEIGAYEGTVTQQIEEAGDYFVSVRANGDWSMSLSMD